MAGSVAVICTSISTVSPAGTVTELPPGNEKATPGESTTVSKARS